MKRRSIVLLLLVVVVIAMVYGYDIALTTLLFGCIAAVAAFVALAIPVYVALFIVVAASKGIRFAIREFNPIAVMQGVIDDSKE